MNQTLARALVHRLLGRTQEGRITLVEDGVATVFGDAGGDPALAVTITVKDPRFHAQLLRGSLGLGTSYMDGMWETDDLVGVVRIAARNVHRFDRLRRTFRPAIAPVQHAAGLVRRNTVRRSKAQIAAHYDLGNDLYELFLDDTMMYSSAVFEAPDATLHDAQLAKLERIVRKLDLKASDHLLEIGTGWGALALHAARRTGCRVTTTTISREQHALAVERVRAAGLEDRVTVLLEDYRDLTGTYDKLVSIEMIEAVGWRDFDTYFRRCSELLEPDGLMFLQAITIDDRAFHVEKATKSFINQLIFPGGCLPSLGEIHRCVARETDLRSVGMEDITPHYVTTLQHWRARFLAQAPELERRGYDARFRRLWDLYLAYCEGGFAERRIGDVQLLLAKPGFRDEPVAPLLPMLAELEAEPAGEPAALAA
jgi:cyclopropane-fatty-acyl-phospholipid synthase